MPKYQTRKVGRKTLDAMREGAGFDIVKAINSVTPTNIEFHIRDQGDDGVVRTSSFTGPNTNLKKRLSGFDSKSGTYNSVLTPPINDLDAGALEHDIAYSKYKDLRRRHAADKKLIAVANKVIANPNSSAMQKRSARIVWTILSAKVLLGMGQGGAIDFTPRDGGAIIASDIGMLDLLKLINKS